MIRHEVKRKIKEGVDKEELVLLKFTDNQAKILLRWEHSREFEYEGQMYDVIERKKVGDTTYYFCWWDHKETKLNKQLTALTSEALQHNSERQERQNRLLNYFKSLFLESTLLFGNFNSGRSIQLETNYDNRYTSIAITPPTPPPRYS